MRFKYKGFIPEVVPGQTSMEREEQARDRELSQARVRLRPNPSGGLRRAALGCRLGEETWLPSCCTITWVARCVGWSEGGEGKL